MKKFIFFILKIVAVISLVFSAVFGWMSINSFMERINHGPGLMFADAEIFLFLTLFFLALSIVLFWIGKKQQNRIT
ncbi:MAG: hypothetical protein IPJ23_14025 [Ignavibacteriales bacterium]|nr:hypothetical protein [Ignavibacteriales bacterium]